MCLHLAENLAGRRIEAKSVEIIYFLSKAYVFILEGI
jgi:hypothetical protein